MSMRQIYTALEVSGPRHLQSMRDMALAMRLSQAEPEVFKKFMKDEDG
jgi:hypothetical protein